MNFADIRNHLYNKAETTWWWSLLLGFAIQGFSAVSSVIKDANFTVILSVILFFLPVVARWLQEKSRDDSLKAMMCRLAILYSDAFGDNIPLDLSKEIKSWTNGNEISKAPFKRPYYDSKLPHGSNRLADISAESAFWTYKLAGDMRMIMTLYSGLYFLTSITALYFFFQLNIEATVALSVARLLIAFVSLVFTSEIFLLIKQYNELHSEAKRIFMITSRMVSEKKLKVDKIMQIVEGYNILLASSPPIPNFLYRARRKALNKAYKIAAKNE